MTSNITVLDRKILNEFPDEVRHLAYIYQKIEESIKSATDAVYKVDNDYMETKRYMVDNAGDIDPHEMHQTELLLNQIDRTGNFTVQLRDKYKKLYMSPYFGRIDFKLNGNETTYYIGRFAFTEDSEILIVDWRAPISGIFYDDELGKASYTAPVGEVSGTLTKKRQFGIKNKELEYVIDTSTNIQDQILQKELNQTTDDKMKTIISTIQKEQNRIIRYNKNKSLIIQGVAGSGKTSIALHRVAYLLYRHKDKLSSESVAIISPNKVFANYISNVLPELGEEPLIELTLIDIAIDCLGEKYAFDIIANPLDIIDQERIERIKYKSTKIFFDEIKKYAENNLVQTNITDYRFENHIIDKEWIQNRYEIYSGIPIKKRLPLIAKEIEDKLHSQSYESSGLPKSNEILRDIKKMIKAGNPLSIYKNYLKHMDKKKMFMQKSKTIIEWEDVFPLLYIKSKVDGLNIKHNVEHLIIDEMQDYTPVQYAVLNLIYPCSKTILGDFSQKTNPYNPYSLDELRKTLGGYDYVELNRSYRSTIEIMSFAQDILKIDKIETFARHGASPNIKGFEKGNEEIEYVLKCLDENDRIGSTCIIVKSSHMLDTIMNEITNEMKINAITPDSETFSEKINIATVNMSKGLEFDRVIIPFADKSNYYSDIDRNLLYIAATRATKELIVTFSGEITKLISYN